MYLKAIRARFLKRSKALVVGLLRRLGSTLKSRIQFQELIRRDPLNPVLHLQFAFQALHENRVYLSYAEFKTAQFLGAASKDVEIGLRLARAALPAPERMNHNGYYRLASLASELATRSQGGPFSVLDVGGGEGMLAPFIPDASYCLADPDSNGISGLSLPFPSESFDYVVSCHVLEHIPPEKRIAFLDQLLLKAKRGVILLGPFFVEGTHEKERLRLFIDVTNAQWAREHLECSLPRLEHIRSFADQRKLGFSAKPTGTLATGMAIEFMNHFADKAGLADDKARINEFFNVTYRPLLDSIDYPVGYLVYLCRTDASDTLAQG